MNMELSKHDFMTVQKSFKTSVGTLFANISFCLFVFLGETLVSIEFCIYIINKMKKKVFLSISIKLSFNFNKLFEFKKISINFTIIYRIENVFILFYYYVFKIIQYQNILNLKCLIGQDNQDEADKFRLHIGFHFQNLFHPPFNHFSTSSTWIL